MTDIPISELRRLHAAASPALWRGAIAPIESIDDLMEQLRANLAIGPDAVDYECFHVLMGGDGDDSTRAGISGKTSRRKK